LEAPDDGNVAAVGIVEEELGGASEIVEAEVQADTPMEETKAVAEAHEAEV
jgi:hypothetical protein